MLVLTRKTGQKLIINDNIEVIILETKGESVKIGIKAPKNVTIYREEIYEEIKKTNLQASKNVHTTDLDSIYNIFENINGTEDKFLNDISAVINTTNKNRNSGK